MDADEQIQPVTSASCITRHFVPQDQRGTACITDNPRCSPPLSAAATSVLSKCEVPGASPFPDPPVQPLYLVIEPPIVNLLDI